MGNGTLWPRYSTLYYTHPSPANFKMLRETYSITVVLNVFKPPMSRKRNQSSKFCIKMGGTLMKLSNHVQHINVMYNCPVPKLRNIYFQPRDHGLGRQNSTSSWSSTHFLARDKGSFSILLVFLTEVHCVLWQI